MSYRNGTLEDFIRDMEPFFYGKSMTYLDVGAFQGVVFDSFMESKLKFREVHLFEPNPKSFQFLSSKYDAENTKHIFTHNIALSDKATSVQMKFNKSMTRVVDSKPEQLENFFSVETMTLDSFVGTLYQHHVSILKVDVEGHEMEVLNGGSEFFEKQCADIVYIEAGLDSSNSQQTYYRDIDDFLTKFNYRIFKIYEQTNEWIDDSPALRRVNIAYISSKFSKNNPYKVTRELFAVKNQFEVFKNKTSEDFKNLNSKLAEKAKEILVYKADLKEERSKTNLLLQHVENLQSTHESQAVEIKKTKSQLETALGKISVENELKQTIESQKKKITKLELQLKPLLKRSFLFRLWRVLISPKRLKAAAIRRLPLKM